MMASLKVLGPEDHGGLKFIRWDYRAKNQGELSVQKGDEMILKGTAKENFMKVQVYESRRVGLIPERCFIPRKLVVRSHKAECKNEISVSKGDVIGEIEKNVGGSGMCKVFKYKLNGEVEEGNIPQHCFYENEIDNLVYRTCCTYLYLIRTMIQALILAGAAYCIQPTADRPEQNRHQLEVTSQKHPSTKLVALRFKSQPNPTGFASSPKSVVQSRERTSDIICLCDKPSLSNLQSLRHANGSEVRIIDEIAPNWYKVALALDIKSSTINIISEDYRGDCVRGCTRMISTWIDSEGDVTWRHLIDALDRANFKVLASDVKSFTLLCSLWDLYCIH